MKKITVGFIISFIMMLSLCACGGKSDAKCEPNLNKSYSVNAVIEHDGTTAEATMKRYSKSNWDVEFSSPNTLAGVLLSFRDNNVEASYKGLSFSVPKSALPIKSIISSFIEVADMTAELTQVNGEEKENEILTEGETELGKYTLKFDKNGMLTGFEMPNLTLVMTFTDFCEISSDMTEAVTEATETLTEAVTSAESNESENATDVSEESEEVTEAETEKSE